MEIDVVMAANTPLWKAHDLSQQLQDKIEVLPNVDRAFVHVDHETTHAPVRPLTCVVVLCCVVCAVADCWVGRNIGSMYDDNDTER